MIYEDGTTTEGGVRTGVSDGSCQTGPAGGDVYRSGGETVVDTTSPTGHAGRCCRQTRPSPYPIQYTASPVISAIRRLVYSSSSLFKHNVLSVQFACPDLCNKAVRPLTCRKCKAVYCMNQATTINMANR